MKRILFDSGLVNILTTTLDTFSKNDPGIGYRKQN